LGNLNYGVIVSNAADSNIIGGGQPGSRNIISGNLRDPSTGNGGGGVFIWQNATGNSVHGNFIGTNVGGITALPNETSGIEINGASGNMIGSVQPLTRNIISGNGGNGVLVIDGANSNVFQNNAIGLAGDSITPMPNFLSGVQIYKVDPSSTPPVGNAIGGTGPNEANIIAYNGVKGVDLLEALNTSLLSNSIFSNSSLGIDLAGGGVTANDPCDADAGSNGLQNFPVTDTATNLGGITTIQGNLDSIAGQNFIVQIFVSDACDMSSYGEGQTLIDSFTATTGPDCHKIFGRTFSPEIPAGKFITSTATDASGNTSEFSKCKMVSTPTAANASIAGRVMTANGQGITNVRVTLTGRMGQAISSLTGPFGYYRFENLPAGESYILAVYSKRFMFAQSSTIVNLNDDLTDINFTSEP
ncbi:MAG: carboxypeptidase-like regulatory domain-containing protein, partial [Acidobacteriota bacterium]